MTPFIVVKTDIRITRGVALWNSVIPSFAPANFLRYRRAIDTGVGLRRAGRKRQQIGGRRECLNDGSRGIRRAKKEGDSDPPKR
jgi:hypothetical protein